MGIGPPVADVRQADRMFLDIRPSSLRYYIVYRLYAAPLWGRIGGLLLVISLTSIRHYMFLLAYRLYAAPLWGRIGGFSTYDILLFAITCFFSAFD